MAVPFCFPKFVHEYAAMYHELRKAGTGLRRTMVTKVAAKGKEEPQKIAWRT